MGRQGKEQSAAAATRLVFLLLLKKLISMKKKLLYIFLLTFVGIFFSCVNDCVTTNNTLGEGDGIKLTMSVSLPRMQSVQTRGVLDNESLNPMNPSADYLKSLNLYMFIFENTGSPESNYLLALIHGDRIKVTSIEQEDSQHSGQVLQKFTANVEGTSEKAIIHLVATSDPSFEEQLQNATDRTELGLFYGSNGLYTGNEYPAFWKRIDLDMPITKDETIVKIINEKLSHVQMVRNFCRVTVNLDEDATNLKGFVIDGYAIVNQVDKGYVAAYSDNDPRRFVEFEAADDSGNLTGTMKSYADIFTTDKYMPARHPLSVRAHKEEEITWLPASEIDDNVFTNTPKYMFERPYQDEHRSFVVIKGHFAETPQNYRYIKFDIGDIPEWHMDPKTGFYLSSTFEYRHLYRNFSFDINITAVASTKVGSATAAGAITGAPTNNVGATVEAKSIQDISDGIDRMWVNQTKFVIVDTDDGSPNPRSFDLMWRYVSDWQAENENETAYIKYDYPGMTLESNDDSGIFQTVTPIAIGSKLPAGKTSDEFGDWGGATITFNRPDETVRQKTVRLYYSDPSSNKPNVRLSRDITFVMRKRWSFVNNSPDIYPSNVEVYPGAYSFENYTMPYETLDEMRDNITPGYVGSQRGAQLTVMFELPEDLPQAIFPLDFKIGFDRQNVENAYAGNAVVTTGPSMFEDDPGGVGVLRLQFVKTVTWDYYHGDDTKPGHRIVTARFTTTNDVLDESGLLNADKATTRVRVSNQYFTLGADDFERAAHDDVIDPTRTYWYWNFSYPEWATYFDPSGGYADCRIDPINWPNASEDDNDTNPHDLNNLNFAGYSHGASLGTYMQVTSDLSGVTRSDDNPELWFPLEHMSETGYSAKLTVKATPHEKRQQTGGNFITGYEYAFYDRIIHATVLTDMNTYTVQSIECKTPSGGDDLRIIEMNFNFNILAGETIKKVQIWSEKQNNHANESKNTDAAGETRYYSIEFSLTPKEF